ncbi:hypothetical protein ACFX1S_018836 [Malus domestica]
MWLVRLLTGLLSVEVPHAPMSKFVLKRPSRAKSGLPLERLAIMKNDKVDFAPKVTPRSTSPAVETDSPAGKVEAACVGSYEKSTKPASREVAEIYVLLKPHLFEDMDVYAKLMALERLFTQVPLRSIRPSIGRLFYLQRYKR